MAPRFYQPPHQQPPPYWGAPPYQQQPPPAPPMPPPPAVPPAGESKDDRIHRLEREVIEARQAMREMAFESRHQSERMQQLIQDMRDTMREEQRRSDAAVHVQPVAAPPVPAAAPQPPPGFIVLFDENSPTGYVTIAEKSLDAFYASKRSSEASAAAAPSAAAKKEPRAGAPAFVGAAAEQAPPGAPPPYQSPPPYQPYPLQYQQPQGYPPPPGYPVPHGYPPPHGYQPQIHYQQGQGQPPQQESYPQGAPHAPPQQGFQAQGFQAPGAQAPGYSPQGFSQAQGFPTPAPAPQAAPPPAAPAAAAAEVDPVEAAIATYNQSKNTINRLRATFGNSDEDDAGKDSGEAAAAASSPESAAIVAKPEMFYDNGFWKFPLDKEGKPMTGFKDALGAIPVNMDKLPMIGSMFLDGASKMLDMIDRRGAKLREETELLEKQERLKRAMGQLPPKQQQQQQTPRSSFSGFPAVEEIPRPPKN